MTRFIDQLEREMILKRKPRRIVSLVPSLTELLFDLDLEDRIVGITKFCVHPGEKVKSVQKVGGTKNLYLDKIALLNPDLIIASKEENTKEQVMWLCERFSVWISDIYTVEDAISTITSIGEMTDKTHFSRPICDKIQTSFDNLRRSWSQPFSGIEAAYFIWKDPLMAAGRNTFIDNVLQRAGLTNFLNEERYPLVDPDPHAVRQPHLLLLSSEPYPFTLKHEAEFSRLFPRSQILLVDGEMFSWYGSRLQYTADYIRDQVLKKIDFSLNF